MSRIWTLGLALLAPALACAQVVSETYRIHEEDRISIQVFDEPQIQGVVVVTPDGNIAAPFAGLIRAVGKTTTELEADLADIYTRKLRLKDPKVSVSIVSIRRILVTITGAVNRPGQFEARPGQHILDVLSLAGPDPFGTGDLRRATFKRQGWSESIPIDLYSMINSTNLSQNYEIEDGDTITVPTKRDYWIRVWGEVIEPQEIPYDDHMNVLSALTRARGVIPNRAKQTRVLVFRRRPGTPNQYFVIQTNMVAYAKGDFKQNITLQPGDTVYVPNNGNPNFELLNSIANAVFILDRFGINIGTRG